MVLQVNLSNTETFGVIYEILRKTITTDADGKATGGVSIFDQIFGSRAAVLGAGIPGTFPLGVSGIIGAGNAVRAFVNALLKDSRVRVLSSPSVLATDNRPARIQVGTEEPIPTGTITAASGGVNSSTTIQYRNTGRILTIIPQVNSQGLVNLQVKAEVSARGENVAFGTGENASTFPSFETQDAETTAVVHDGETLVIGGLIGERKSKDRTGIPYLMDLPIVGRFFGVTIDDTRRTELIMLITPHVIRNRDESRSVTEEFKSKISTIRNELERIRRDQERDIEKLKSQMREQPKPGEAPVGPAEPARPPVSAPTRPGAYFSPAVPPPALAQPDVPLVESAVRNNDMPPVMESQDGLEMLLADIETVFESVKNKKLPRAADAIVSSSKTEETAQPVRFETESAVSPTKKSAQRWVVQVAAFAQAKDADLLCKRLRDKGYDAQVHAVDVGGKTWHRVQLGELASRQEAFELQKNLMSSEKLEQTFVASR
jgi:cell division septation protein DedD